MMPKVFLVNLGCPKNLVDSEIILGLLEKEGHSICNDINDADVMLVNTCAFIEEAKEESIDLILELCRIKKEFPQKKLMVIGCMVKRYPDELPKEIPLVDHWISPKDIPRIPELVNPAPSKKIPYPFNPLPSHFLYDHTMPRRKITPYWYTYVKISEGCSNHCSYCAVPDIKGNYKSRPPDSILKEVKELVNGGTKEIILIAQDTTSYGNDLPQNTDLRELIKNLCAIDNLKWLRILYAHPAHITPLLIEEIARHPNVCKYIDIPLQHIDSDILYRMNRKVDSSYIRRLVKMIRHVVHDVVLRTSFIVGFPGETEEKFRKLLDFMEEIKFERLGIFTYSKEEGTPAASQPLQIPHSVKEERFHKAMQLQQKISKEVNRKLVGRNMEVILEGEKEGESKIWFGRSYMDAPEVDGQVYTKLNGRRRQPGDIIQVKVTDTMEYDLVGEVVR